MINIVLFEPEIPPNTGNLIRLSANTGINIHLIEPLGFSMNEKALRRAGLDYSETARVRVHKDFQSFINQVDKKRVFMVSTKGIAYYHKIEYQVGDTFIFGPETRGLPKNILEDHYPKNIIRLPMLKTSRSLNLSNCAAIVAFEALRQIDFKGLS